MRKNLFLLSLITLGFLAAASGQSRSKVSGAVFDTNNKPLQSITLSLLKAKDSSLVKIAITGKDGRYEFDEIVDGNYRVVTSSIGFDKATSDVLAVNGSDIEVKAIQLIEGAKSLAGVTVTAKKPFIETRIDKTIVNVDASPTNAGANALEVLEKSPGITVDNDGNISLKGKAGVIVMMDGKPTYLSPADLANMLKGMPASALDQIEIMTNPSSKYDAAGNSGIINIKTKKGRAAGFNGSIMVGSTNGLFKFQNTFYVLPRSQNSFTFNYRKNKINIFGNYNPNFNRSKGGLTINRTFVDDNDKITGYSDVLTKFRFGNNNHTLKLGMDYFADKKNTYGVVLSGFIFNGHPTPVTITTIDDENHQITSSLVSLTENKIHFKNFSSNFNYRHVFDTSGRELSADLDYIVYSNVSNMLLTTDFFDNMNQSTSPTLFLSGHLPSNINIYSFKSDYTNPFKKGGRFEAGIKSSYVTNDNLVDYKRMIVDKWVQDSRSNHFIYDENINAAYVNLNTQIKKWSFQGGVRVENTVSKGYQVTNDSTFKRNFTNLFPSAFISYALNKTNTLTLSYSRRITRPNYQDLNPFTFFLDSLSYREGNPFLLPQFTHNIELSHSFNGKLTTTLNYNNTSDVIAQILKQNPQTKIVFLTVDNVARFTNIGVSVTAQVPVAKWWNSNIFTNVYNNHYKGVFNGDPIDLKYTSFLVNVTNSFTIKQGFTLELSGFYRGKGVDQLNISEPMYQMSIGGQKNIMKGKATVRLNIRDPFAWQQYKAITKYSNVDVKFRNRFDARSVGATFTYRFGKNNQQTPPPRRRNSATQDEQNRVGNGQ